MPPIRPRVPSGDSPPHRRLEDVARWPALEPLPAEHPVRRGGVRRHGDEPVVRRHRGRGRADRLPVGARAVPGRAAATWSPGNCACTARGRLEASGLTDRAAPRLLHPHRVSGSQSVNADDGSSPRRWPWRDPPGSRPLPRTYSRHLSSPSEASVSRGSCKVELRVPEQLLAPVDVDLVAMVGHLLADLAAYELPSPIVTNT